MNDSHLEHRLHLSTRETVEQRRSPVDILLVYEVAGSASFLVGDRNRRDEDNVTTKGKEDNSGVGKGDQRNEKRNTRDLNDERQGSPKGEGNLNDERNGNEGSKVGQGDQGNERKDFHDLNKNKQEAPKGEGNVTNDERNKAGANKDVQRSPGQERNLTNEGNKGERTQEGTNQTRKQNEPATQKPGGGE